MKVASLESVFRALNDAGARYLVAGGIAVIAHGYVRFTHDLDLVIALERSNIRLALETLENLGYRPKLPVRIMDFADPEIREMWIREKHMLVFQLVSENHPTVAIDIFVREPFRFEEEESKSLRHELAPDVLVPVISLETLLRLKREANRPSDQQDVRMLSRHYHLPEQS